MAEQDSSVEEQIINLQQEMIEAMIRGDSAALNRILADDFIGTNPLGQVNYKSHGVEEFRTPELTVESIETDDLRVRIYGDSAVVTGQASMRARLKDQEINMGPHRFTSVYVRDGGRWQLVATQATMIAQQ
ncbi:MAG TPA: nuclear transport factor 2 family protein [Nitrososphaera sp.]|nr:nuclear transport factor 2 family protein [Nitrososphaera sp.]